MKFEQTKCKGCGRDESPLYMRTPPRDIKDVWCQPCTDKGEQK